ISMRPIQCPGRQRVDGSLSQKRPAMRDRSSVSVMMRPGSAGTLAVSNRSRRLRVRVAVVVLDLGKLYVSQHWDLSKRLNRFVQIERLKRTRGCSNGGAAARQIIAFLDSAPINHDAFKDFVH